MKISEDKKGQLIPKMITGNKETKEVDPLFFVVKLGHGMPKTNKYAYIKRSIFPLENNAKKAQTVIILR